MDLIAASFGIVVDKATIVAVAENLMPQTLAYGENATAETSIQEGLASECGAWQ